MKYTGTMDPEVIKLCDAINTIDGVCTVESCCGHGKEPFRIWLKVKDLEFLPKVLYWLDYCHSTYDGWGMSVHTDCVKAPVNFMITGPVGKEAYRQADKIAALITG